MLVIGVVDPEDDPREYVENDNVGELLFEHHCDAHQYDADQQDLLNVLADSGDEA